MFIDYHIKTDINSYSKTVGNVILEYLAEMNLN